MAVKVVEQMLKKRKFSTKKGPVKKMSSVLGFSSVKNQAARLSKSPETAVRAPTAAAIASSSSTSLADESDRHSLDNTNPPNYMEK